MYIKRRNPGEGIVDLTNRDSKFREMRRKMERLRDEAGVPIDEGDNMFREKFNQVRPNN